MVDRWVHIEFIAEDPWVLPIWVAVNTAVNEGRTTQLENRIIQLGLHISTRLNFLPRIVENTNNNVESLYEAVSQRNDEHESTNNVEGVSLRVNRDLIYNLLINIDSLLFELNSVCDLIARLFENLHNHIDTPMPQQNAGLSIREVLQQADNDASWFNLLDRYRNFFIHEGAPYIAVDITNEENNYDLLLMKSNLTNFDDETQFLRLSAVNSVVQGFLQSKPILQQYLINKIQSTGAD